MDDVERWQVSGSEAEQYERFVASWFGKWADDLVDRAGLQPGWRVLDVACGTGVVTRTIGPRVGSTGAIVATDLNEGMLAEARLHAVEGPPVEWRAADAQQLPFDDRSFNAVFCQQGLQFVPDRLAAVSETRRVLRPGGVAAISVWSEPERNPYIAALAEGLSEYLSSAAGGVMLAPCALGDPNELSRLFSDAEVTDVQIDEVMIERAPTDPFEAIAGNLVSLPIAAEIRAMDRATYQQMIEHIIGLLDAYIIDDQLVCPSSSLVAIYHA